jgi:O-antigen ligase
LVLLVSLVLVDLFILGSWFGLDRVRERLEKTVLTQEERYHVDVHGLGYLDDFWVTGSGGGTFAVVFPAYRDQGLAPHLYVHAHNDYLESLLEYGVLGVVLPGGIVLLSVAAALRVLYRRRDPLPRGMAFASLMGIMAILIHSTADFNLHIPANAALFVVLISLPWLGLDGGHRP